MLKQMRKTATIVAAWNISMKGAQTPPTTTNAAKSPPNSGPWGIKTTPQFPFSNLDPFQQWHGVKNIASVRINGESCMALLDNGAQINTIIPKYVSVHSLQMGPITDLLGANITCMGLGNAFTRPLGYVIIWVQVDGVQGYDEDQIALVFPDLSNFVARVPVILGTPPSAELLMWWRRSR